jgi:AraC-like DNA-binding protein
MSDNKEKYISFRIPVPVEYEEIFSHFYVAENRSSSAITKTLFPSFQTILIFNFGVNVHLFTKQNLSIMIEKCIVLGPIKHAFDYTLPPKSEILVANFKDDAFYRFFGHVSTSQHLSQDPDDLLNANCFTMLWTELQKIANPSYRVVYILGFCKSYLRQQNAIAKQLINFEDISISSIKSIADIQNQSQRNIQLNHKKYLGYSAKEVNRFRRFLKAISCIQKNTVTNSSSKIDWFEIIEQCGYYDQSQLIHDFKHYIHLTPTKYLKFQHEICHAGA